MDRVEVPGTPTRPTVGLPARPLAVGLGAYRAAALALLTATDAVGEAEARATLFQLLRADGVPVPETVRF